MSLISFWRTPAVTLGFSSKRTKSAPLLFLYAFLQSSFACIYCHRRKNVLNMGEGGKAKDIGGQGLGCKPISWLETVKASPSFPTDMKI